MSTFWLRASRCETPRCFVAGERLPARPFSPQELKAVAQGSGHEQQGGEDERVGVDDPLETSDIRRTRHLHHRFCSLHIGLLACGLAPTLATLVAARLAQGVGAALLVPNSLSLLSQAFPDKEQRSRAVGWWGAAGGIALAVGPVVGGFLVTHFDWRSVFLINIPVGLGAE